MSNQVILWSMLLPPWFSLFFLKKDDVKRYMPVAMFAAATSTIISDVGLTFKFWVIQETAYPLHQLSAFIFGLNAVLPIWIFKYTYGRFWLYVVTNLILDIGFDFFLFGYFFPMRNILYLVTITPFQAYLITTGHALLLYAYQKWQDEALLPSGRTGFFAAKPFAQDDERDKNGKSAS